MTPESRARLIDMLHYAHAATRILGGLDAAGLAANEEKLLAVTRAIEIIGEAASRVSKADQAGSPAIDWSGAIGMRHKLIHGYASVSPATLVDTIRLSILNKGSP